MPAERVRYASPATAPAAITLAIASACVARSVRSIAASIRAVYASSETSVELNTSMYGLTATSVINIQARQSVIPKRGNTHSS